MLVMRDRRKHFGFTLLEILILRLRLFPLQSQRTTHRQRHAMSAQMEIIFHSPSLSPVHSHPIRLWHFVTRHDSSHVKRVEIRVKIQNYAINNTTASSSSSSS